MRFEFTLYDAAPRLLPPSTWTYCRNLRSKHCIAKSIMCRQSFPPAGGPKALGHLHNDRGHLPLVMLALEEDLLLRRFRIPTFSAALVSAATILAREGRFCLAMRNRSLHTSASNRITITLHKHKDVCTGARSLVVRMETGQEPRGLDCPAPRDSVRQTHLRPLEHHRALLQEQDEAALRRHDRYRLH